MKCTHKDLPTAIDACPPDCSKKIVIPDAINLECIYLSDLPIGWELNRDKEVVDRISRALIRTGGDCPCVPHTEWNESTMCPCAKFRAGEGCHCNLFVKIDEE